MHWQIRGYRCIVYRNLIISRHKYRRSSLQSRRCPRILVYKQIDIRIPQHTALKQLIINRLYLDLSRGAWIELGDPQFVPMSKIGEEYRALFNVTDTATSALDTLAAGVKEGDGDARDGGVVRPEPAFVYVEVDS